MSWAFRLNYGAMFTLLTLIRLSENQKHVLRPKKQIEQSKATFYREIYSVHIIESYHAGLGLNLLN